MSCDSKALRSRRWLVPVIVVIACSGRDTRVGCSPTPSCSSEAERFAQPEPVDAGAQRCGRDWRDRPRCAATQLALGREHSCGLSPSGEVLCWGSADRGQLGGSSGTPEDAGPDVELQYVLSDARAIAAGAAHSCGIDAASRLHCWGDNASGQVDGRASAPVTTPVVLEGLRVVEVAAGGAHTCARVEGQGVYCWGSGRYGQTGREIADRALAPARVAGTDAAVQVSAGERHSCALSRDGSVRCWGELFDAEAGELRAFAEPRRVPELDDASEVAAGAGFSCARRQSGAVVCWGNNTSGELGDGSTRSSEVPVEVAGLELTLQIAAGGTEREGRLSGHACAVTKSFFVQCWGRNREGQAGQTSAEDVRRATLVVSEFEQDEPQLDDVTSIAAGGSHSCAIEDDGEVVCWGDDTFDQLGARESVYFGRPVEVRVFRGEF